MTGALDVSSAARSVSDARLSAATRGEIPALSRAAGLRELDRRGLPEARRRAVVLVADPAAGADTAVAAAGVLGRESTAEARRALVAALDTSDPRVFKAVVRALGRIGDRAVLDRLKAVAPPAAGYARRRLAFAKVLISYRLGLETHVLERPPPSELLELRGPDAVVITAEPLPPGELLERMPSLEREVPEILVTDRGALRLRCQGEELICVLRAALGDRQSFHEVLRAPSVVAVVFKQAESLDTLYLAEYIFGNPRDHDAVDLFGVSTTGGVLHFGTASARGAEASFHLSAVRSASSLPLDVEGRYMAGTDRATLALTRGSAATTFVRAPGVGGTPHRDRLFVE